MSDPNDRQPPTPPKAERPGARQTDPTLALDPSNIPEEYAAKLRAAGILKPKAEEKKADEPAPAAANGPASGVEVGHQLASTEAIDSETIKRASQLTPAVDAYGETITVDRSELEKVRQEMREKAAGITSKGASSKEAETPVADDGQLADTVAMDLETVLKARDEARKKAAGSSDAANPAPEERSPLPNGGNDTAFKNKWLLIAIVAIVAAIILFLLWR